MEWVTEGIREQRKRGWEWSGSLRESGSRGRGSERSGKTKRAENTQGEMKREK